MKKKIYQCLLSLAIALGLFATANIAYAKCVWVPGHMYKGTWYPAHKVCNVYRQHGCKWVNSYWYRGIWHQGHRVCW